MSKEAVLNPLIESLDKDSKLYELYQSFKDMIDRTNSVDAPDFTENPPMKLDKEGNQIYDPDDPVVPLVDTEAIERKIKEYSEIQTKNYAYDLANAIYTSVGGSGSGSGGGTGYLPLTGGSLSGPFSAMLGAEFQDAIVKGQLTLADKGIVFNKHQSIFVDNQTLNIDYPQIKISGDTEIDGPVTIGKVTVDGDSGMFFDGNEYYHAGNSNLPTVDWEANNLHVYGTLTVDGGIAIDGRLTAVKGFDLGEAGEKYFYSSYDNGKGHLWMTRDLTILGYDNGIKFDDHYIIKTRSADHDVISFSAPGRTLNLGDSDNDPSGALDSDGNPIKVKTKSIALQTDFRTADDTTTLITPEGKGYFLGLKAKSVSGGSVVLETYRESTQNEGVLFNHRATFNRKDGPSIYSDDAYALNVELPYLHADPSGTPITDRYFWNSRLIDTDSLFRDQQLNTPTVAFGTDAQFFRFEKPVESQYFAIASQKYQTKLQEGCLFLNVNGSESLFLQAVSNGIFHSGNATFNHSLSSVVFTSGFMGVGWGIIEDPLTGDFHATFDGLTVRKKMRLYELEVQKVNVTNGSWWVSDSCSGDFVVEVV